MVLGGRIKYHPRRLGWYLVGALPCSVDGSASSVPDCCPRPSRPRVAAPRRSARCTHAPSSASARSVAPRAAAPSAAPRARAARRWRTATPAAPAPSEERRQRAQEALLHRPHRLTTPRQPARRKLHPEAPPHRWPAARSRRRRTLRPTCRHGGRPLARGEPRPKGACQYGAQISGAGSSSVDVARPHEAQPRPHACMLSGYKRRRTRLGVPIRPRELRPAARRALPTFAGEVKAVRILNVRQIP